MNVFFQFEYCMYLYFGYEYWCEWYIIYCQVGVERFVKINR